MMRKQSFKHFFSLALAAILLLSLGCTAFAAEDVSRSITVSAASSDASEDYGTVSVSISDALQANTALEVLSENGHRAEVTAAAVSAGGEFPTGLSVSSKADGSLSRVTAGGVSAKGEDSAIALGVTVFDGGRAEISVGEQGVSAVADDYAIGLHAGVFGSGTVNAVVQGDLAVSGGYQARGAVLVAPASGSENVTVNGNLTARSNGDAAAAEIDLGDSAAGDVTLRVHGDLLSNDVGLLIQNDSTLPTATVVVDGTIKGQNNAIVVSDPEAVGSLRLVAWKIVRSRSGSVAETTGGMPAAELQKAVHYIVRTSVPEGVKLSAAGVSYQEDLGLYTAHEGDELSFFVELPKGVKLEGVYNGEKALEQGADGGFRLSVPRGGGVEVRIVTK